MEDEEGFSGELARQALARFAIQFQRIVPLRRSDNITFRIEARDGRAYLLRIHRSSLSEDHGCRQERGGILSELAWLTALSSSGFEVQRPVPDLGGEMTPEMDWEGRRVFSTLMTWIDGTAFDPGVHANETLIARYGQVVAALHEHASSWQPPPGFSRPVYDRGYFDRQFAGLEEGRRAGIISSPDWEILQHVQEKMRIDMDRWAQIPGQWGLIHADLHTGNILVRDEQVLPIDFSLCGYGSYLFDLSIALTGGVPAHLRRSLLAGYRSRRPLSRDDVALIHAGGLAGFLGFCAFQINNPARRDWFSQRIPRFTAEECQKYLRGAPVYFDEDT